jgi:hypothetical protein
LPVEVLVEPITLVVVELVDLLKILTLLLHQVLLLQLPLEVVELQSRLRVVEEAVTVVTLSSVP